MCGIAGYKGRGNAGDIAISCLKRLEYRGYDSFGIAYSADGIKYLRRTGKITDFSARLPPSSAAIAHTRWATHGAVSEKNCHPQFDCSQSIALIHNGIIENYQELKQLLASRGHIFKSDTDTETLSHLIEENLKSMPFREACMKSFTQCTGSSAFVAMDGKGEIAAYRKNSPLVIGLRGTKSGQEYFIASDIPAFLTYTRRVILLHDGDFVYMDGGLEIWYKGKRVNRKEERIEWETEEAEKGDYAHFMLKEITEQRYTMGKAISHDEKSLHDAARRINNAFGIFMVACGSSYHACLAAAYTFSRVAKKHINVVLASEFPAYSHFLTDKTLVISVSQSGETADVLEAVRAAREKGSEILSIVNVIGSSLTRYSDSFLTLNAGPEMCVLSTKTYTSQLQLLSLLAYASAGKLGEGKAALSKAGAAVERLTGKEMMDSVSSVAETLKNRSSMFVIGRGIQYANALETALKIKEVSYIHAEGLAGGELKHGTIALIENGTPCIALADKETETQILSNAMEIKSRGGRIIGVSPVNSPVFDSWIQVPDMKETAACHIIPMQLLAYKLAVLKGIDPDRPRNLAKAVTVK